MSFRLLIAAISLGVFVFLVTGWIVTRPIGYAISQPNYIVAETLGETEYGGSPGLLLDSVKWSGRSLVVEATQVFAKGPFVVREPKYTLKGDTLHIDWVWSLLPGTVSEPRQSGHRVRIEIGGLGQRNYSVRLEPMLLQD